MLADCGIALKDEDDQATLEEFLLSGRDSDEAVKTRYLSSVKVTKTAAANIHSFCVSSDGSLFGWGCG